MERLPLRDLINDFALAISFHDDLGFKGIKAIDVKPGMTKGVLLAKERFSNFARHLRESALPMSADPIERIVSIMNSGVMSDGSYKLVEQDVASLAGELQRIGVLFPAEVGQRWVTVVAPRYVDLLADPAAAFGPSFQTAFQGCLFDLEEAVKCLAASRATAAVFHLVRCLEAGLRAIARCLNVPDPITGHERNWAYVLGAIRQAITARWPHAANKMSGDGKFFESLYASLSAMKSPYRDATMHLDNKYTEEEAGYAFELIKGLMMKIANRMDENGKPEAATS